MMSVHLQSLGEVNPTSNISSLCIAMLLMESNLTGLLSLSIRDVTALRDNNVKKKKKTLIEMK